MGRDLEIELDLAHGRCRRATCTAALRRLDDGRLVRVETNGSIMCTGEAGRCGCPHAEQRLIVNYLVHARDDECWAYQVETTLAPCSGCANLIVLFGRVRRVIYDRPLETDPSGVRILRDAGIDCSQRNRC